MRRLNGTRRAAAILVVAAIGSLPLTLTGCTSRPQCLPAPLRVNPSSATAGQQVTLSAAPAACDLGYEASHTYTLALQIHGTVTKLRAVPVHADGSFTAVLTVPAATPAGTAEIVVTGSPFDHCDDTASCAAYATTLHIR